MRSLWMVLLLGCAEKPLTADEAEAACLDAQEENGDCFPEELMEECVAAWTDCRSTLVMESCPIQFGCSE